MEILQQEKTDCKIDSGLSAT